MTTHQIDVLLTIVIDRGLQAQLFVNGLLKCVAEIGHLLDEFDELLQFQTKKNGGCDGANGNC